MQKEFNFNRIRKFFPDFNKLLFKFNFSKIQKYSFIIYWLAIEFSFVSLFTLINLLFSIKSTFPNSVESFLNSFWAGSIIISSFLALILMTYVDLNVALSEIIKIDSNCITLLENNFYLCVFTCQPPILHSMKDFSHFLENFSPISIEFYPDDSIINFIIFGTDKNFFYLKTKECYNQLCSFYSKVKTLEDSALEQFVANGFNNFKTLESNSFNITTLEKLKSFKLDLKKQSNTSTLNSIQLGSSKTKKVFLLPFLGKQGKNIVEDKFFHSFRGVRIGLVDESNQNEAILNTKIRHGWLRKFIMYGLRLPDKNAPSIAVMELEKIYFYLLHKNYNYIFNNPDNIPSNEESTQKEEAVVKFENKHFEPEQPEESKIFKDSQKSSLAKSTTSIENTNFSISKFDRNSNTRSNLNYSKKLNEKATKIAKISNNNEFINLKEIFFQFTPFCNYFCPKINDEFKMKSVSIKNNFNIPNGCYEHITRSNSNFYEFFKVQNSKLPAGSIFKNDLVKERFLLFINEKNLPIIDRVCHFSSLLLFSRSDSSLNDEQLLNFIQELGENFFK